MLVEPLERALAAVRAARAEADAGAAGQLHAGRAPLRPGAVGDFAAGAGRDPAVRALRRHRPALHRRATSTSS